MFLRPYYRVFLLCTFIKKVLLLSYYRIILSAHVYAMKYIKILAVGLTFLFEGLYIA